MWKYRAVVSYVGRDFCGWQKQKEQGLLPLKPSLQAQLEGACHQVLGETPSIVGSGRTDAGVHAAAQVFHFVLRVKEKQPDLLLRSLNGVLPAAVRVWKLERVAIEFHAQRSALKKQYSYYFQQGPTPLPHLVAYSWWIEKTLDLAQMQSAVVCLEGEHDFKPFQAAGSKPGSTVRLLEESAVSRQEIHFPQGFSEFYLIRLTVRGSGFLKQMVRGIAGTLLQVGEGRRGVEAFAEILASQDRRQVGPTAPARGLWLEQVWYP